LSLSAQWCPKPAHEFDSGRLLEQLTVPQLAHPAKANERLKVLGYEDSRPEMPELAESERAALSL